MVDVAQLRIELICAEDDQDEKEIERLRGELAKIRHEELTAPHIPEQRNG